MSRWVIQIAVVAALMGLALPSLAGSGSSKRGATRVDFDDTLIKGQTNRGAVHLIERKDSNLGSLVKKRKNYRKEIVSPYGYQADSGLVSDEFTADEKKQVLVKNTKKKKRRKKTIATAKSRVRRTK